MSITKIKYILEAYNQEHLLQFWHEISEDEKNFLKEDLLNLNVSEVMDYFSRASLSNDKKQQFPYEKLKPIPHNCIESTESSLPEKLFLYEKLGLEAISNGEVAVILLAGGQGTRLGVNFPKGMFDIGLPSHRTLYHLQSLRIKRLQNLAKDKFGKSKDIIWYIMTSDATHETTLTYFEKNKYFGLKKKNVIAFKQSTLPCFSLDGKIILDDKHRISKAPDGNGGLYTALKKEGILNDMKLRGIHSVHVYSVDNVLVRIADPIFLGYCRSRTADCGVKVVRKRSPDEPVGVVCQVDGLYTVVEYSEISASVAELRNNDGSLLFNSANICNHYFTLSFLQEISEKYNNSLDLHIAKKKIPYVNETGIKCIPTSPNGIKIEKFIFDVFKYSKNLVVWEVQRENEFSALKNSESAKIDCPSTARNDVLSLHKKWLSGAGVTNVQGEVEISPLLSYAGENICHAATVTSLKGPLLLE